MLEPVFESSKTFECQDLYLLTVGTEAGREIWDTCHEIAHMLVKKNISYGNSFQSPINIFSKELPEQQLLTRIDDKLNRIKNAQSFPGDNDVQDLVGYLILLMVLRKKSI